MPAHALERLSNAFERIVIRQEPVVHDTTSTSSGFVSRAAVVRGGSSCARSPSSGLSAASTPRSSKRLRLHTTLWTLSINLTEISSGSSARRTRIARSLVSPMDFRQRIMYTGSVMRSAAKCRAISRFSSTPTSVMTAGSRR